MKTNDKIVSCRAIDDEQMVIIFMSGEAKICTKSIINEVYNSSAKNIEESFKNVQVMSGGKAIELRDDRGKVGLVIGCNILYNISIELQKYKSAI